MSRTRGRRWSARLEWATSTAWRWAEVAARTAPIADTTDTQVSGPTLPTLVPTIDLPNTNWMGAVAATTNKAKPMLSCIALFTGRLY